MTRSYCSSLGKRYEEYDTRKSRTQGHARDSEGFINVSRFDDEYDSEHFTIQVRVSQFENLQKVQRYWSRSEMRLRVRGGDTCRRQANPIPSTTRLITTAPQGIPIEPYWWNQVSKCVMVVRRPSPREAFNVFYSSLPCLMNSSNVIS